MSKKDYEFDIFRPQTGLTRSGRQWYYKEEDGSLTEVEWEPEPTKDSFLDGTADEVADDVFDT